MARKFKAYVERSKPPKRPRRHTKKLNKNFKDIINLTTGRVVNGPS